MNPTPTWSAAGLTLIAASGHRDWSAHVHAHRALLTPELCRSAASWLRWLVGDLPHPADPDQVRMAVDDARTALRHRSASPEVSEDFRAGLAWVDHHLEAIAHAAAQPPNATPEREGPTT